MIYNFCFCFRSLVKDRKLKDKLDPLKDMEAYLQKKKHKHKDKKEKVVSDMTRAAQQENLSTSIYGQQRSRSPCAFAQSDQGLHCLSNRII